MTNNRRNFIKQSALTSAGIISSFFGATANNIGEIEKVLNQYPGSSSNTFNMSGYGAPPLDLLRVGFIGVGKRGYDAVSRMSKIEGVEIRALCDLRESQVKKAYDMVSAEGHKPELYHSNANIWKKMCERKDIDLIYILTPWALHTEMAVFSMNNDKHVCVEVPAGKTLEELWALVNTSERTRKHCMMVENCCYDFFELTTLNMVRQGFFGEITHCEGAYIHELTDYLFSKDYFYQMWQLSEQFKRTGNLYPTHGLGPICQALNINRGDKMDFLVSVSSKDFIFGEKAKKIAAEDSSYNKYIGKHFNGTMNTSTIKTNNGKTIVVQFDIATPRPYSRIHLVSGTKGIAQKYPEPGRISTAHTWLSEKETEELYNKYKPELIKKIGEVAKKVGGHGGMDFLMDWRTVDCLRNGLPLDQDVYDAALWSSVSPLSVLSVLNKSNSVKVPDFTRGSWKKNKPVDLSMQKGGTTKVKL